MKELRDLFVDVDFATASPQDVAQVCSEIQHHPKFIANHIIRKCYTQMLVNAIKSGDGDIFEHVCRLDCPGLKDQFSYPADIINALQSKNTPDMRQKFLQFLGQCPEEQQHVFARYCLMGDQYRSILTDVVQHPQTFEIHRAFAYAAVLDGCVNYALRIIQARPELLCSLRNATSSGGFYTRRLNHVEEQYERWDVQRQNEVLHNVIGGGSPSKQQRKI